MSGDEMSSLRDQKKPTSERRTNRGRRSYFGLLAAVLAGPVLTAAVVVGWLSAGTETSTVLERAGLEDTRQPGLLVRFARPGSPAVDARISRFPALNVEAGDTPTPFLDPGPFEAQWEGWIEVAEEDRYTFHFEGNGSAELKIEDRTILQGEGAAESEPVQLEVGDHKLVIHYNSPLEGSARMRLLWSSSRFYPELVPATALSHETKDEQLVHGKQLRQGRELLTRFSCLKCHEPEDSDRFGGGMPELERDAPDLSSVGSRFRTAWMQRWLEDPYEMRSSTKMPGMAPSRQDAADMAAWLSTLGDPPASEENEPITGEDARIAEGGRLYASLGCVSCHSFEKSISGDSGERLSLSTVGDKWYPAALARFLSDPSEHYRWIEMPDFRLSEREAAAIASYLISETPSEVGREVERPVPEGDSQRGEQLIARYGCSSCHVLPLEDRLDSPSLESITQADWRDGWLGNSGSESHPNYPMLGQEERETLIEFADEGFGSLGRRTPTEFAGRQIQTLDCVACHELDGRADRWSTLEQEVAHLIPQGEEPFGFANRRPPLTWAGEKLHPQWLSRLLSDDQQRPARPWLEARMPTFQASTGILAQGMIEMHGLQSVGVDYEEPDPELVEQGRGLTHGLGTGFFCQSCHHGGAGGGFPAPALELLGERLRGDFFQRMMFSPRRVDPETGMPEFADSEGRTRFLDVFGGDAERQFDAIWNYLLEERVGRRGRDEEERVDDVRWAELFQQMDKGPFYSGIVDVPEEEVELEVDPRFGYVTRVPDDWHINKGMAIRVGEEQQATLHFDHDLLRMSAGWTGGFLEFRANHDMGIRNMPPPAAQGERWFLNPEVAGWSKSAMPEFTDSREEAYGPLPETLGQYNGIYLHEDRVVLSYSVGETAVLEAPWYVESEQTGAFIRDFQIDAHTDPLSVLLLDSDGKFEVEQREGFQVARVWREDKGILVAIRSNVGAEFVSTEAGRLAIRFNASQEAKSFRVLVGREEDSVESFMALVSEASEPENIERLTDPGPRRQQEPLVTKGELGDSDEAWVVDHIRAPVENPDNALLHFTDVDFLEDGRAVLTTMHGDVWLVDGLDESLDHLEWRRFATGLNHPFGVRVVNGRIYVSTDDELLILHDRDENGEADYYESFRNLYAPSYGAWRHAFGLEVDEEGNFYFARGRGVRGTEWENGVYRISSDGSRMDRIASGFRQPWGMGISPDGQITVSQQEGTWVPQTPLNIIDLQSRKGSFYGFNPEQYRNEDPYPRERGFEPPLVWMPRNVDNSGSGQVWIDSDQWGLPRGNLLHFSYAQGKILQVMYEQVDEEWQGGVVPLTRVEDARLRTGRFRAQDGQLYVVGLQSDGFYRVRYTDRPVYKPVELNVHENGIRIRFSTPLEPETASDESAYAVYRWNYRWSDDYGSGYYSVRNPELYGEDSVQVESVHLLEGGREVFLEIPDMMPVDQMRIEFDLKASDGTTLREEIYSTIHAMRSAFVP